VPRGNPARGDFTGKETQRLQRENADELVKRQKEVGLASEVDIVIEREGVFDPVTGALIEMPSEAQAKVDALNEPQEVEADPLYDVGEGPMPIAAQVKYPDTEVKQQPKKSAATTMIPEVTDLGDEPILVEQEYVNIRVNTDIEDMTYGVGNTFSMVRGTRYRVARDLAQHLESKGLVYH
jgi:hypothetical protein